MAIDTAIERRMAATMPTPFGVPASPDGTISASDRRQAYGIFFHELIATTIEAILNSLLKEDINIAAIVSTRVYPNIILQGAAMPALTYQQISFYHIFARWKLWYFAFVYRQYSRDF